MFLFSTLLYINGLPVDYSISKEEESFVFEPIFNPHFNLTAPHFTMHLEKEVYSFTDTEDKDIMAQAEEVIKEYLNHKTD